MKLKICHNKTYLVDATETEVEKLRKSLKVWYNNFRNELKCYNIYDYRDRSFPTGFLNKLLARLEKKGIDPIIDDMREYPAPCLIFKKKGSLPPLLIQQKEALDLIAKFNTGIVSSYMATGKSREIVEAFLLRRVKTLVVVPNKSVQRQLAALFGEAIGSANVSTRTPVISSVSTKMGNNYLEKNTSLFPTSNKPKLGSNYKDDVKDDKSAPKAKTKLGSNYFEGIEKVLDPEGEYLSHKKNLKKLKKWEKKNLETKYKLRSSERKIKEFAVTILCYQSLDSLPETFLQSIRCVLIDEAHHSSCESIRSALLLMPNAAFRYAFSGTPWRDKYHEELLLASAIGDEIIYELTGRDAVKRGMIARPTMIQREAPSPSHGVFLRDLRQWREVYEQGIVGNKTRNTSIIRLAESLAENGHNVLICVDEVSHLEIFVKRFEEIGIEIFPIHGQMNQLEKETNTDQAAHSTGGIITIATMAVGEGTDLVNVNRVILAGGGKGSVFFLQRMGRGQRKTATKSEMTLYDSNDWFNPTLARHSRQRAKIFKEVFGSELLETFQ